MFANLWPIYLIIAISLTFIVSANEDEKIAYRLPKNVIPISYRINLITHLTNNDFTFNGEANIAIKVNNRTNYITLHANNLEFYNITLSRNGQSHTRSIQIKNYSIDNNTNFLTINFNNLLSIGQYNLNLKYKRIVNTNTTGFLHRSYTDDGNKRSWMAFTQLEPTGARKIFPCWDEPALKANFTIIINHSNKYTALSNMHVDKTEIDSNKSNKITTYFAETPKMSTYLVGIILSKFSYKQSNDKLIRVYSRNNIIDKLDYIVKIGEKTIKFMDNYTEIPYRTLGFKKLDIVVIPNIGVNIAGMENWGLITIQEANAIIDDGITTAEGKEWATKVIVHECIHQWFGNLITIDWWTDLWINEGITSYFHFFILDQIEKTWHVMDRFVVDKSLVSVTKTEATSKAVAIKMEINNPNEMIWTNYYHTYYKSAYMIRTIAQIIGETKFQMIWKKYLKRKSFQAVTANDIIYEFAKAAGIENKIFHDIFNNWLTTPGFPVVRVNRNYYNDDLIIQQTRYLTDKNTYINNEKYWIPINYVKEDEMSFEDIKVRYWISPSNHTIKLTGFSKDKWVIFNKQQFGYYCVTYDMKNWGLIIKTLNSNNYKKIHVRNRLQLINDAFMLLRANQLSHRLILSLMSYLERETDFIPWIPVWEGVEYLKSYLQYSKYTHVFEEYIGKLINNLIKNIEFDESPHDNHLVKYYRDDALTLACTTGSEFCMDAATKKLTRWLNSPMTIQLPPKLKNVILCSGVRDAQYNVWNSLWHKWLNNPDNDILRGLGCTSNSTNLMQLLYGIVGFDKIHHTYSLPYALNSVATGSEEGVYVALVFLIEHWRPVIEITPQALIKDLITNVSRSIVDEDQFHMLQDFIEMRYSKLLEFGVNPQEIMSEVLKLLNGYKKRHPAYEKFFFSH